LIEGRLIAVHGLAPPLQRGLQLLGKLGQILRYRFVFDLSQDIPDFAIEAVRLGRFPTVRLIGVVRIHASSPDPVRRPGNVQVTEPPFQQIVAEMIEVSIAIHTL
jgi:hypothetical protein